MNVTEIKDRNLGTAQARLHMREQVKDSVHVDSWPNKIIDQH